MLATLISASFVFVAGFAVLSMAFTGRRYAAAWDDLARERAEALGHAGDARPFPATVTVRCRDLPATAIVYRRRFTPKAACLPLQPGRPAAA